MAINLKQARERGKLGQFATEREAAIGDVDAFNRLFEAMAGKSKEAPEASPPDDCDD